MALRRHRRWKRNASVLLSAVALVTASVAQAQKIAAVSARGAEVEYVMENDEGRGWLVTNGSCGKHAIGFKQSDRDSRAIGQVAHLAIAKSEAFDGSPAIAMEIDDHADRKPGSTAYYKVALSTVGDQCKDNLKVVSDQCYIHDFAMKIDPGTFSILPEQPVLFEQFWQGSPFHPPVSLQMISSADAALKGWKTSRYGSFSLVLIDDKHGPSSHHPGEPLTFDLGPIVLNAWIEWSLRVCPSPAVPIGSIQVKKAGSEVLRLRNLLVGYDPRNSQYFDKKPQNSFKSVDVALYRQNGHDHQKIFFSNISLSSEMR